MGPKSQTSPSRLKELKAKRGRITNKYSKEANELQKQIDKIEREQKKFEHDKKRIQNDPKWRDRLLKRVDFGIMKCRR